MALYRRFALGAMLPVNISQGSAATCWTCGRMFNDDCFINLRFRTDLSKLHASVTADTGGVCDTQLAYNFLNSIDMIYWNIKRAGCCRSPWCGCVLITVLLRQNRSSVTLPSWTTSRCRTRYLPAHTQQMTIKPTTLTPRKEVSCWRDFAVSGTPVNRRRRRTEMHVTR